MYLLDVNIEKSIKSWLGQAPFGGLKHVSVDELQK